MERGVVNVELPRALQQGKNWGHSAQGESLPKGELTRREIEGNTAEKEETPKAGESSGLDPAACSRPLGLSSSVINTVPQVWVGFLLLEGVGSRFY